VKCGYYEQVVPQVMCLQKFENAAVGVRQTGEPRWETSKVVVFNHSIPLDVGNVWYKGK